MTGNCALDFETWKPVIDYDNQFMGYCPNFLPRSDGDWRPHGGATWPPKHLIIGQTLIFNYSVALVKQSQPRLSDAEAKAEAARQFLTAGVKLYVAVLNAAKKARCASVPAVFICRHPSLQDWYPYRIVVSYPLYINFIRVT